LNVQMCFAVRKMFVNIYLDGVSLYEGVYIMGRSSYEEKAQAPNALALLGWMDGW